MKNWLINLGIVLSVIVISINLWNLQVTDTYLMKEIDRLSSVSVPISVNNIQDVINQVMQSVVHIRVNVENGWEGSGVYVGNGLIMTAKHIIKGADEFTILFENGAEYKSDYVWEESESDVGFIHISGKVFCDPKLFNIQKLRRGDTVYILGNPFGLEFKFTVTKGIVSGLDRDSEGFFGNKLFFQSDAAANFGNSGGPIINESGEIVGILVGIYAGAENISLCIPADVCQKSLKTFLEVIAMKELK